MLVRSLWVHSTQPISKKQEFSEKELQKPLRGAYLKIQIAMYLKMVKDPIATIPHDYLATYAGVTVRHVRRAISLLKARGSIKQLPSLGQATYRHRPYCRYTYPDSGSFARFVGQTTQYGDLKQMHQTWLSELLLKNVLYINERMFKKYLVKLTICNSTVLERIPRACAQGDRTPAPSVGMHSGYNMSSVEERFARLREAKLLKEQIEEKVPIKGEHTQASSFNPASRSLTAGRDRCAQQEITALQRGTLQHDHIEALVSRYIEVFGKEGAQKYKDKLLSEIGRS